MMEQMEIQGFPTKRITFAEVSKKARWPGRMQIISENPTILLDGAHNAAAVRALARTIKAEFSYDRMILVIGIMADKDIPALLRAMYP